MTGVGAVGARVIRKEDPELLRGRGRFVDDIHLEGMLHAAFVRSVYPHARIRSVRSERAHGVPGVVGVLTLDDLPASVQRPLPLIVPTSMIRQVRTPRVLAGDEVCYCGEAVAVVVADSRYSAEDGVGVVEVEYEGLLAAVDCRESCNAGAATAHSDAQDNIAARFSVEYGDTERAFKGATHTFRESLWQHRGCGHAIECRAALAVYDDVQNLLTMWSATQVPHLLKRMLMELLEREEHGVRVIAPNVGGGFGPKGMVYPEEVAIAALAMRYRCPVKWTEDRWENFVSAYQERDQYWDVEVAVTGEGKIQGVRGRVIHDSGAYVPLGIILPYISATTMPGPYIVPNYQLEVTVALTNKTPTTPVRGAGRPQAVFAMERLVDRVARELGLDRAEVRRRNFVQPEQMPYRVGLTFRDGNPLVYDSGDYPACQAKALELADYGGFAVRQAEARGRGRYVGIGLASYVEGSGYGPFEGATVRVTSSGRVHIYTGAAPQGQGHQTTLAQICADELGVDVREVLVVTGDTSGIALGVGTFASRTAVNAGSAVHLAARQVREKVEALAAHLLEAARADVVLEGGRAFVKGAPSRGLHFRELARIAGGEMLGYNIPGGVEPGLEATRYFAPTQATYSNGCHVAEVEVNAETGAVRILRYTVVHDCGRLINPLIVDGQIVGGVAHGVGNALYEWMRHDEGGQPVTATCADYLLPLATDVPDIVIAHMESPTPFNPIGVKGAGESGAIPAAAAIIGAIENALVPFDVRVRMTPLTGEQIVQLVEGSAGTARIGEGMDR
jgi:carbon-monoxide dehydrogenase large subunit